MPDHDMSQTACIARVKHQGEHEKLLEDVESLKRLCITLYKMNNCNRDAITTLTDILQEHTKCLKQDS